MLPKKGGLGSISTCADVTSNPVPNLAGSCLGEAGLVSRQIRGHIYLADYTTHRRFHQLQLEYRAKKWRDSPFNQKRRFLSAYADCKSAP